MAAELPPTLGLIAADFIEANMLHGPGDMQGRPVRLTDEAVRFLCDAYELDPATGRRKVRRAMLVRPKGWSKSELAAFIALFEALGPARCSGFDGDGEPIAAPIPVPIVRIVSTEENQTGNIYDNIYFNVTEGPLAGIQGIDAGLTRINLPRGGNIKPVSSGSASKDGGREPLALDTPVATTDGWRTIGTLKPGDHVFAPDGSPVLCYGITPVKYDRPCYRVTFDDGSSIVADHRHSWEVRDRWRVGSAREQQAGHEPARVLTTEQLRALMYEKLDGTVRAKGQSRFGVPRNGPVQWPKKDLPLDPYVFGLWLGDGDARDAKIAVGGQDYDDIVRLIEDEGFATRTYTPPNGRVRIVRFNGGRWNAKSGTSKSVLRGMGVLQDKHVPADYLTGSVDQRLALLQGLMDSDGYANERGNCTFTNTSADLCDAVVALVRSLGWVCTGKSEWRSDERWQIKPAGTYRVSFTPHGLVPFRLGRKAERCRAEPRSPHRSITAIDPVPSVPVACIAVDSDDHLFLAGETFIATHNTHVQFDELHLFTLPELHRLHATYLRNLRKRKAAEPWSLETTTAYRPGERSVAETAMGYAAKIAAGEALDGGFLYDHLRAPTDLDLDDPEQRMTALKAAYGDCDWVDLEQIVRDYDDPTTDRVDWRRYYLSEVVVAADSFMDPADWAACADASLALHDGDAITIGMDTSLVDDGTAVVACRVSDGYVQRLGYWQRPEGRGGVDWQVPYGEVDACVRQAMDRYRVLRVYSDPQYAHSLLDQWSLDFGAKRIYSWPTNRAIPMAAALERLFVAVRSKDLKHDGDSLLALHAGNARTWRSSGRTLIRKAHPHSADKIDLLVATTLAYEAAADARTAGEDAEPAAPARRRVWSMR